MELGHNYNIQCMKLFQELKGAFPATPDEVVRQCMKSNRNVKEKCLEDLGKSWKQPSALLSHQLEQLFKLERELRNERDEMGGVKAEVQDLEMKVKQRAFSLHNQAAKAQVRSTVSSRRQLPAGGRAGEAGARYRRPAGLLRPHGEEGHRDDGGQR